MIGYGDRPQTRSATGLAGLIHQVHSANDKAQGVGPFRLGTLCRRLSIGLAALIMASGCGLTSLAAVDRTDTDPVWLTDGWVYFLHQDSSDAPWQIWRRRPDGSAAGLFAAVKPDPCPASASVFLFEGSSGRLGAGYSCDFTRLDTTLVEYSADGRETTTLAIQPTARAASWRGGPSAAYLEVLNSSCWGIVPMRNGTPSVFPAPVTLAGLSWPLDPASSANRCDSRGISRAPAVTRDGKTVYFLISAAGGAKVGQDVGSIPWRLASWVTGEPQPSIGTDVLVGASSLVLSPDDKTAAVAVDGPGGPHLLTIALATGQTKQVGARINATGLSFSPDGKQLIASTVEGDLTTVSPD
ncbi:hypothetical protein [Dactylosporangium sp. NPDC051484]|uniref:TolB family protein n=1 Tax=Dactylosporangium sp. NPDC051484 TaxID=3154942 RepID=UPI003450690F